MNPQSELMVRPAFVESVEINGNLLRIGWNVKEETWFRVEAMDQITKTPAQESFTARLRSGDWIEFPIEYWDKVFALWRGID